MRNKGFIFVFCAACFLVLSTCDYAQAALCGNNIKEGWEECDNGYNNSDSRPDACRTDCTLPKCGDYGVDSGEECDDYPRNSDEIPNACRTNCRRAYCGDGVLDEGEECDDKNSDPYDGCHQCQTCYLPKDGLTFNSGYSRVRLCPGRYEFTDAGQEGIIIINAEDVELDCQGVTLVGLPPVRQGAGAAGKIKAKADLIKSSIGSKIGSKRKQAISKKDTPKEDIPPVNPPTVPRENLGYQGTGILVKHYNSVIHGCNIEGFKNGIKLKSYGAVLYNNHICGNQNDIVSENPDNYGIKNSCFRSTGWQESGAEGCLNKCN